MPDDVIEEVRLAADPAGVYVQALRDVIGEPLAAPNVVKYTGETYNKVDYDPRISCRSWRTCLYPCRATFNVGWYGAKEETLRLFAGIWQRLGFTGKIFLNEGRGCQDT